MTLIALEGFELQDMTVRPASQMYYPSGAGGASYSASTRFSYGSAFGVRDIVPWRRLFTAASQVWTGFAWSFGGHSMTVTFYGDSNTTAHLVATFATDGSINVTRGGTSIGTAPAGTITTWCYVEMSASISDTVGIFKLRINGSSTDTINFSGDTKNAGTATTIDSIGFVGDGSGGYSYVDDFYICNNNGSVNNSFLGDVRVYSLAPTGAGTTTTLTPSTGSNWSCVDEQPYNTTDFVSSPNSGDLDLYAMADVPAGSILGVQAGFVAKKSDAGLGQLRSAIRSGSTNYFGTTQVLSTSYLAYTDAIREVDPNTSAAWTLSGINAIEAGAQVQ